MTYLSKSKTCPMAGRAARQQPYVQTLTATWSHLCHRGHTHTGSERPQPVTLTTPQNPDPAHFADPDGPHSGPASMLTTPTHSLGNHAPSHQGQPAPSPPLPSWSRPHTLSHSLHPRHTRAPPPEAQERHLLSLTEGRAWGPQHGSSLRNRCFSAFLVGPGGWPGKREDPRREH